MLQLQNLRRLENVFVFLIFLELWPSYTRIRHRLEFFSKLTMPLRAWLHRFYLIIQVYSLSFILHSLDAGHLVILRIKLSFVGSGASANRVSYFFGTEYCQYVKDKKNSD